MKRKIISIIIALLILLIIPVGIISVGFGLPAQYGNTYYAVLPKMFKKLKQTEGKKIIVIGNSAVAFGLDPGLIENEIDGYTVCPFGLYGAIGTKTMMDLSRVNIGKDDIVVLAPELASQSLSLYFNSEYVWNAADGDFSMLKYIKDGSSMAGGFIGYVGRKFNYYINNSAPNPTDVYAASSFDENCKMIYERPYNQLPLGYDAIGRISYNTEIFADSFAEYVNDFNRYVEKRGAKLFYGFSPVNVSGIEIGTTEEDIDYFYDYIDELLDCEILGNPNEYIFEKDWFYDSNVHVNSAGAVVYTDRLVRDLKAHLGNTSPTEIVIPEKPQIPDDSAVGEDGKDAALFNYEPSGSGWNITSLTKEGKTVTSIEIPDYYQGKKVISFDASVFAGNTVIKEVYLGRYVYVIAGGSFSGCSNLKLYVSKDAAPSDCIVYLDIFDLDSGCEIYVPQAKLEDYKVDYFWSHQRPYLVGY